MSNLLEQASLVMIPSGYKEDIVYSEIPIDGSGDLQFTRASDGTRINSQGLVEVVPWNLITYSEQFQNANWIGGGNGKPTMTDNFAEAPNGTMTASKMEAVSDGYQLRQNNAQENTQMNLSVWLRTNTGTKTIQLFLNNANTASQNITVTTNWTRYEISGLVTSLSGGGRNGLNTLEALTSSNYILVWGFQLSVGLTAKPYFPTTDRLNVPRLTYQNGGGGCPSLLLEPQRTNLALYSNALSTSPNIAEGSTATENIYISPDGTQNAIRLTETIVNDIHGFYQYNTVSAQTYTASVWTKQTGRRYIAFYSDFTGSATASYFDLQTISVVSSGSGHTCSIQDFGNGWFRLIVTLTATAGSKFVFWGGSNNGSSVSYAGSTSISQTFYGYQLEASSYPTSYIPTTSSSATRVADACFKTGISSLIGQTSGTLFVQWINLNNDLCNLIETYNSTSGVTGTSSILIQKSSNNQLNIRVFDSLGNYSDYYTATMPIGTNKIALAYESGSAIMYLNGASIGSNSRTYVFGSTRDSIAFDNRGGYARSEVILFPTRLTNAELASLTTI